MFQVCSLQTVTRHFARTYRAMSTLVYRFDDAAAFPLLETETTARGPVTLCVEGGRDRSAKMISAFLRIALQRRTSDPPEITVVIGLPLIAIDGNPERLLLDVLGDASGCRLFVEGGDARGWGFCYSLGEVDFTGWRECWAEVQRPTKYWGQCKEEGRGGVVMPLQPFRVGIRLSERCRKIDVGLGALRVTGDVRLVAPGIA